MIFRNGFELNFYKKLCRDAGVPDMEWTAHRGAQGDRVVLMSRQRQAFRVVVIGDGEMDSGIPAAILGAIRDIAALRGND